MAQHFQPSFGQAQLHAPPLGSAKPAHLWPELAPNLLHPPHTFDQKRMA